MPHKEITEELKSRFKSSIFGSIAISWSILHWKVIVAVIFGPDKIYKIDRIEYIHLLFIGLNGWEFFCDVILFPVFFGLGFLVISTTFKQIWFFWENRLEVQRVHKKLEDEKSLGEIDKYGGFLEEITIRATKEMNHIEKEVENIQKSFENLAKYSNGLNDTLKKRFESDFSQSQNLMNAVRKRCNTWSIMHDIPFQTRLGGQSVADISRSFTSFLKGARFYPRGFDWKIIMVFFIILFLILIYYFYST